MPGRRRVPALDFSAPASDVDGYGSIDVQTRLGIFVSGDGDGSGFVNLEFHEMDSELMSERANEFYELMRKRRLVVRLFLISS